MNHIEKVNIANKARAHEYRRQIKSSLGDLVWLCLKKKRFPSRRKNKLLIIGVGASKIIERVGDNAYNLQFPRDMAVSSTFSIAGLSPYVEDCFKGPSNLRWNPLEEGEVNARQGIWESLLYPNQVPDSDQAKEDQGKQALIHHIHSLLSCSNLELSIALDDMIIGVLKTSYG